MPLFSDVSGHNDALWRKALGIMIGVAPFSTTAITSILDPATGLLKALPTGFVKLGRVTEDGVSWPRETEVSELFGHGSSNPGRSDIRRATKRVSFTLLESTKRGMELAQGLTISAVPAKVPATTGNPELKWDEPELPDYPVLRLIAIAKDTTGTGEMYIGRQMLRCKVTEVGEETWSDGDSAMVTPLTLTAYHDYTAGSAMRHFRGGPGFTEVVQAEGFPAPV